jgi:hypothetical protein
MPKQMMRLMMLAMLRHSQCSMQASPSVEVVLAHHHEDLSWLAQHGGDAHFRIYTKWTGVELHPPFAAKIQALPNVGRESHTYLSHIVQNYDTLAGWTVFSQAGEPSFGYKGHRSGGGHLMAGDTFAKYLIPHPSGARLVHTAGVHLPSLDHVLRASYCIESELIEEGSTNMCPAEASQWTPWWENNAFRHYVDSKRKSQHGHEIMDFYHKYINPSHTGNEVIAFFPQGARFAVSRDVIRRRPKSDYERLLATLSKDKDPYTGYYMEWLWSELFLGHQKPCSMPVKVQPVTHADAMESLKQRFPSVVGKRKLLGSVGSGTGVPVPSPSPAVVTTSAEPATPVVATKLAGTAEMSVPDCTAIEASAIYKGALMKAYAIAFGVSQSVFVSFEAKCDASAPTNRRLSASKTKVDWVIDLAGQPDIPAEKAKVLAATVAELTKDSIIELCAVHLPDCGTVAVVASAVHEETTTLPPPCAPITTKWVDPCTPVPTPAPVTTANPCAPVIAYKREEEQTSKVESLQRMTSITPIAFAAFGVLFAAVILGVRGRRKARETGYLQTPIAEDHVEEDEASEAEAALLSQA